MEENVRKELNALEEMVLNWKRNYLSYATPDGNNDFLVEEFQEEITQYLTPYLRRMFECEYLTDVETAAFRDSCYDQVEDLRRLIRELENPPVKPGVWQEMILKTKVIWQD